MVKLLLVVSKTDSKEEFGTYNPYTLKKNPVKSSQRQETAVLWTKNVKKQIREVNMYLEQETVAQKDVVTAGTKAFLKLLEEL